MESRRVSESISPRIGLFFETRDLAARSKSPDVYLGRNRKSQHLKERFPLSISVYTDRLTKAEELIIIIIIELVENTIEMHFDHIKWILPLVRK